MRRHTAIIFLGIVSLLLFGGCQKDKAKASAINLTSIIGSWELRQAQNGMIPTVTFPSGNGNILKFSNSTYEKYENGNLVKTGEYTIIEDNSVVAETGLEIASGQFTQRIVYDNDLTSRKTFIQISDNKLNFLSGYFPLDGGSSIMYEGIGDSH